MTRDLINALAFNYSLLCRGRRCFDKKTIELMNESSKMITDHIDEISQFLLSLEIC